MEDMINTVIAFHKNDEWREILALKNKTTESHRNSVSNSEAPERFDWCKLLWVWPTQDSLNFIQKTMESFDLQMITSIGCGTGLFEWILQQSTGIHTIGIEVDEDWWSSAYAAPQFIPLVFMQLHQIHTVGEDSALLFCYFNNESAFQAYLRKYRGPLLIIIGPGYGRGTHTNPTPFSPHFGDCHHQWDLLDSHEIGTTKDFIAMYKRM